MISYQDSHYLERALDLAHAGGNAVRPNPLVGALVVRGARVLAEGYHAEYGGPHAEAVALERAGAQAKSSTLYCNLEPCSYSAPEKHNGPCTHKIIEAGVSRVVVGQLDPNPRVRGRGIRQLREAGIEVDVASTPEHAWYANARFNTAQALSRPFVTLKLAQSLDGRVAAASGDSKWISDTAAREEVHAMRGAHDAVMVGIGTVLQDDPMLTVRNAAPHTSAGAAPGRQPRPVVVDTHCRTPIDSYLVRERAKELIVLTDSASQGHSASRRDRVVALRSQGVTVLELSQSSDGTLPISAVLEALKERGIQSLMVEGGAKLATSFLRTGLYDALRLYVAPILLGGDAPGIGSLGIDLVGQAVRFEEVRYQPRDGHILVSAFREGWFRETRRAIEEVWHVHRAG